jgi:hypothetical protein
MQDPTITSVPATVAKTQPWKAAWPPAEQQACPLDSGVEYGVEKGEIAVVDGAAANVRPVKKDADEAA